jgi:N-acetylneuraminic acid mutarotase
MADKIYVVGGYAAPNGSVTGALESYDVSSKTWRMLEPLPIAVNHAGVTSAGGMLYVHGGFLASGGPTDRLYRYDPERDHWARLADAPIARGAMAFQAIGDRLFAVGGTSASNPELRRLWIYDVSRRDWNHGPNMEVGRNHVASAVLDGRMYVIGGRPGPIDGNFRVVERYNPDTNEWRRVARLPTATSGAAAAAARVMFVVFGGEKLEGSGETIGATGAYDPARNRWRKLPSMITPRHGLGGASRKGRVFAIEGGAMAGLHFSRANEYLEIVLGGKSPDPEP